MWVIIKKHCSERNIADIISAYLLKMIVNWLHLAESPTQNTHAANMC